MTPIIFLLVLGVLVLTHEWGHFFVARKFGVRVNEFGFGFPPRVFGYKIGETLYSLNLIPLGGFVKIFGEGGEDEADRRSFAGRPVWQRALIIAAGVFMNLALAWALFTLGFLIGAPAAGGSLEGVSNARATITGVAPQSPAAEAKISFGDVIRKISAAGETIEPKNTAELIDFVNRHKGENLSLELLSGSADGAAMRPVSVMSRASPPPGEGPLGIALADIGVYRAPWHRAPWDGLKALYFSARATADALAGLFRSAVADQKLPADVSGPVGIYVLTGQMRHLGAAYLVQFVAALSVNLALFNIIPFPALDGGRLLFLAVEKVRGRAVRIKHEQIAHAVGFAVLIALVLAVSYQDVARLFL